MPIYEYLCQACGHELEAIQKMSDAVLTDCPICAKPTLKKQLSAPGFQLKGSGWYATDFKNSGKKKDTAADTKGTPSDTKEAASSDTKESKPRSCAPGTCGCH